MHKPSYEELEKRIRELEEETLERGRAEQHLRLALQHARSLIEASPDPMVTISPQGEITDVNEATIKTTGVVREVIIGTEFSTYFTDPRKAREGYRRVFREGSVTDYPLTIRHRDGKLTHVLYNASLHKDLDGKVLGVFATARDVSEQMQASRYARSLIEASLDPLVTISAKGKITDVNEATIKATGLPRGAIIGTEFSTYFTEPWRAREGYRKVFREGSVTDYPLTIRHRNGKLTHFLYNASLYKDVAGNILGVFAAARDITERKRAEQALGESQQMLHSVLDTIPVRVFWKDVDSTYLGCNHPFALDAGLLSPEEIIGKNDFDMGWTQQAEAYRSDDRLVMETGKPKLGYEELQTTPDGRTIWLRTNKVPLRDSEGMLKGVLGTYEDITESKQMEEMLQASETRYRIVADNTHDWEHWTSPGGLILYVSPSCQRITGYSAADFEADPELASRIVHPEDLLQFQAHLQEYRTDNTAPGALEFRIIHRDGTTRWIGHVCQSVFDESGNFMGRRGSNRDITDQKNAERALEESSRKLKFFAYSVAHDLKSPAIGVYGLTKRLSKHAADVLDETGRTYCHQILKVSEHIATLVEKINIYIATKEAAPLIEPMKISEIVRMLRDEFSVQFSLRRVELFAPEFDVKIRADRLSVLRIFRNTIDNALKYGGESLTRVSIGYVDADEFHIFSVTDDGKGVTDADSKRIFGLFQRHESSRGVEGAGLGLAIVKEIAEQHGGRVWVDNQDSKGITFYVSISKNL
ncbi:MAG: PAS domain S-box protein [Syntrophobacteraceae bacterium]|nr:PAS domain S-box protein [Syntrophobacteraceae bacterium]